MEDIYTQKRIHKAICSNFPWNFSSSKMPGFHGPRWIWHVELARRAPNRWYSLRPGPKPPFEQTRHPEPNNKNPPSLWSLQQGWKSTGGIPEPDSKADENGDVAQQSVPTVDGKNIRRFTSWYGKISHYLRCFITFQVVQDFWTIKSISDMSLDFDFIFLDDSMDEIYNWWSWKADRTGDARFRRAADKAFQAFLYVPCENNSSRFDQKRAFGIQPSMWYP